MKSWPNFNMKKETGIIILAVYNGKKDTVPGESQYQTVALIHVYNYH